MEDFILGKAGTCFKHMIRKNLASSVYTRILSDRDKT